MRGRSTEKLQKTTKSTQAIDLLEFTHTIVLCHLQWKCRYPSKAKAAFIPFKVLQEIRCNEGWPLYLLNRELIKMRIMW